ncbi:DUF2062 domain-containing protein [Moheibacter sediminis]|uniref:Glycosyltransferase involved in cell wall bisynthesis n=1 Tax=Moheibacter sediminis TaxID=1434700 RepID=A0A1W1YEQ8_9FLAO|nr:DUF2062 domain-containing protein [Moheibacter sediminis]SMC34626.1 Glycosyltransferase involved in cell wall bisynthesis [Moheibacter sediminis]
MRNILSAINACVIIPTYNNEKTLKRVLLKILEFTSDIIVVNDGSTDSTPLILNEFTQIQQIHFPRNKGKGFALRKGFKEALKQNFDYAITIDSDGQHFPEDIVVFVDEITENGESLLIGDRNMEQEGIPKKSSFGNRFSNFWFCFETGIRLNDTQSGFRLYPIKRMKKIKFFTRKFEFEIEVIVKSAWKRIPVKNVPIHVLYDESERVSHFRPFKDFTRISLLNTWLVIIALLYIKPRDYIFKFKKKGFKRFFLEDLLHSEDSKLKKTLSVMLGVFIGLSPLWGFHTITVLSLAFALKLNKLIAFAFSNVSIPPFIPFIVFGSLQIGSAILGKPNPGSFELDKFDSYTTFLAQHLSEYLVGSFILSICGALVFGAITYLLLSIKFSSKKNITTIS